MSLLTIIQARTGSTRLPNKTLAQVGDRTILEWVIHRTQRTIADIGTIIVATTARGSDNPIEDICRNNAIECFRGPEHDVLRRYHLAADHHRTRETTGIIRITADCPLLCPELLALTCEVFNATTPDYAGVEGAPKGLAQEIISWNALNTAFHEARRREDREHVITYIQTQPAKFNLVYLETANWMFDRRDWRLTLDEKPDLDLLHDLFAVTEGRLFDMDSREILDVVAADAPMLAMATRQP
jgi:spore coat polysaccharide biosynthesis protein SpsF (cytidylyltransferase family)